MIDLFAKTIIPGQQGTYRHLTTRVSQLFAESGLTAFTSTEAVLFIGRAREEGLAVPHRKTPGSGRDSYPWIVKTTGALNHFSAYAADTDSGPFSSHSAPIFPYNAQLCITWN